MSQSRITRFFTFAFCIVILNFAFCILHVEKASAAAFSLSVDPPLIAIQVFPPAVATTPITLSNLTDSPLSLIITLKPFKAKNELGEIEWLETPFELERLVKLYDKGQEINKIKLASQETRELMLTLDIPGDVAPQDSYFSILFHDNHALVPKDSTLSEVGAAHAFSQVSSAVATNVILSVGPWEKSNIILDFVTSQFYSSGPVPFEVVVTNQASNAQLIHGEIRIKNLFGQPVGQVDLKPTWVLGKSMRRYEDIIWNETLLVGIYNTTLTLKTNNEDTILTRDLTFFAMPYEKFVIGAIIVLLLLISLSRLKSKIHFN